MLFTPRFAGRWASRLFALAALLTSAAALAQAPTQSYPNRALKFIVPYPAGGSTDIIGRMLAGRLSEAWGQPVVVENRTGASGIIGNDFVAKSPADGYTVLIGITAMIQSAYTHAKLPYDPFKDFAPVAELARSSDLFVVAASVPANNLKEFVALAKANPKTYNYGSYGNATSSHIHGEMFNMQAGLELAHVPYKGAAPMINDLYGGQINTAFVDVGSARSHLASGRFKVLALTGTQRFKFLPDVPTFGEAGYPGFEPNGWFGMFLPAATPGDVVKKLSAEIARIVRLPEVATRLNDMGLVAVGSSPDEFAAMIKADAPEWGKVIKGARIKIE
jgi:tripartite-type tricarboxylate transporter receptor subunit TctC